MAQYAQPRPTQCALEGCTVPIAPRSGGGRPRLYCSDAHRAEARRRRLAPSGPGTLFDDGDLAAVRRLLMEALERVDDAARARQRPHDDARVAAARAAATAELLAAQQVAADATRRAATATARLGREREQWEARMQEMAEAHHALEGVRDELDGALNGARAELEAEILAHHHDVEALRGELQAAVVAERSAREELERELEVLRADLERARATALGHERQIDALHHALRVAADDAASVHLRAARAEEDARHAARELARLRKARRPATATASKPATKGRRAAGQGLNP